MRILADARIPEQAKKTLSGIGELMEVSSEGLVYEAVSGHPDIFFCRTPGGIIAAPNAPEALVAGMRESGIKVEAGCLPVGMEYPASSRYNAVMTGSYFIHRLDITDKKLLTGAQGLKRISVRQGYTRCSLLPLRDGHFITSDKGIQKALEKEKLAVLFVDPRTIQLPGCPHGFFGGTCGVWGSLILIIGSLKYHPEGQMILGYLKDLDYSILELYDGPLFDGGSLFIL